MMSKVSTISMSVKQNALKTSLTSIQEKSFGKAPSFDACTYEGKIRVSPAFDRNKGPILEAFLKHLPAKSGNLLEVASGPG